MYQPNSLPDCFCALRAKRFVFQHPERPQDYYFKQSEKLSSLHQAGILSEEEFNQKKTDLLSRI
jgi:hypothetical protein